MEFAYAKILKFSLISPIPAVKKAKSIFKTDVLTYVNHKKDMLLLSQANVNVPRTSKKYQAKN